MTICSPRKFPPKLISRKQSAMYIEGKDENVTTHKKEDPDETRSGYGPCR